MTGPEQPSSEKSPEEEAVELSTVQFVVNGLKLSLQQNAMTKEEAIEKIQSWYPDAVINFTDFDE